MALIMLASAQPTIGTMSAHRNGLLRAAAEHSISQPTVGRAHSAYSGSRASTEPVIRNGCEAVSRPVVPGTPLTVVVSAVTTHSARPMRMPTAVASSGASSRAQATFEPTVAASEIGIDFQNRMLRSRRSSCRLPRA